MTDVFAEVRERVTARDAAQRYGIEVKRDFARCPFHGEKTGSLHFFGGQFYCFGCHAKGSSIDFTAQLFGLDYMGAVRRLNEDFNLGLYLDKPATREDQEKARKRRELARLHAEFEAWRRDMTNRLNACYRIAHRAEPPFTEPEILAIKYREALEDWADTLAGGTAEEQMEIYRMRKDVKSLTDRILNPMPQK